MATLIAIEADSGKAIFATTINPATAAGLLDYAFTQYLHGNVGVEYTNFSYGQSAAFVSNVLGALGSEPRSRTENVTVRAGLGWAFGPAAVVAKY